MISIHSVYNMSTGKVYNKNTFYYTGISDICLHIVLFLIIICRSPAMVSAIRFGVFMKKLALILPILLSTPVYAKDFFFKPYVGADYQYTHIDYEFEPINAVNGNKLLEDSLNGGNIHLGARVHNNLGFEAGYFLTENAGKSNILGSGLDSNVKLHGFTFDALGYVPVTAKTELIGTVGLAHQTAKLSGTVLTASSSDSETKGRIGGGAQYWVNDNFNVRGLVRYQDADFDNTAKSAIIANLGINYQF